MTFAKVAGGRRLIVETGPEACSTRGGQSIECEAESMGKIRGGGRHGYVGEVGSEVGKIVLKGVARERG